MLHLRIAFEREKAQILEERESTINNLRLSFVEEIEDLHETLSTQNKSISRLYKVYTYLSTSFRKLKSHYNDAIEKY